MKEREREREKERERERERENPEIIPTAVGIRSNAMPTHQDLRREPHSRTSQKTSKDRHRRAVYTKDLR